ncbi:MAG TPA: PAS domain S-box protein [Desulfuromonadales bacterium]|nr:PAS domain S-box protein [Desulfuromonadales bacterium]
MDTDLRRSITPDDFYSIISSSIDGFLLVDLSGNILETNDSYCQMVGYSRDELLKLQIPAIDAIDNEEDVARRIELIIQNGSLRFETKLLHKDGTVIDVEVSTNYDSSHGGLIYSFIRDISTQKHLNEIMAARLRLMEFSLTHSLIELLRQTLDEAEALTGSCIGFYHFKDPVSQVLTLQAWSTKTATMSCKAEGSGGHYPVSQAGVWVDCIRERRPVIHNDYESLPHKKGLPDGHASVIRELVVPIFRHDKIVAIMGLGNKATDYTQQDVEVISTLADLAWDVAERRCVEEELVKQRDFSNRIFNSSDANLAVIDKNGVVLGVNDAWCNFAKCNLGDDERSWGVGANYFVKYDQKLGDTEQTEEAYEGIRKVQSGELDQYSLEYPCHSPHEKRWFLLNVLPLKGNDGSVIVSHTNITARKLAEEALKDSESRWNFALEGAGDGVWDWNILTGDAFYSVRFKEILGFAENEIGNTSEEWLKRIHPDDSPRAMAALQPYLDGRAGSARIEFRMLCKDGSWKWILSRGMVVSRDSDGKPLRMIGTNTDITERKKIEEVQSYLLQMGSQTSGEDFFESLARYLAKTLSMDYVCIDRLQGDCLAARTLAVYHDGEFEDNVEYTLKDTPCGDVVGKEVCVFPKDVRNMFPRDAALQDLQAESYVGTTLWSFDMKPIGLIAVIGRKELNSSHFAETVLKLVSIRAAGELERRQADEEKSLLEQQLQHVQKLESLGVLAGGIAHDFNNILAIIMGYCSLTKMDYESAEKNIPEIEKAAERAAALCRQMLAYAGKAMFVLSKVNMAALVDEMVQMLKATTNQNVEFKSDLSADVPTINGDASQLRQIVMNLIINASEAIGEAQGVVHVSLAKTALPAEPSVVDHLGKAIPPGWYARLEVADTGCGMDDETMRRIFEPFYTTKFTGRGLGMSATLGIITAHKGALQLKSQPDQGTIFTIYLPIDTSDQGGDESTEQIASTPWHGSGTLLLVEDEDQVRLVAKAMLESLGFNIIEASNGREALELYQNNVSEITLVLTDIGMPVMDGYTLFRELKAISPELPIIISSGFGDTVVTTRIPRGKISGLINKPYRFEQLRDVVKRGLDVTTMPPKD